MSGTAKKLREDALALPEQERELLAGELRLGEPLSSERLSDPLAKLLRPHKRPRAHFVAALPRNAMGEVQKRSLIDSPLG